MNRIQPSHRNMASGTIYQPLGYQEIGLTNYNTDAFSHTGKGFVFKYGKVCYVRISIQTAITNASGWINMVQLPDGSSTTSTWHGTLVRDDLLSNGSAPVAEARIQGGYLQVYGPVEGAKYWGGVWFVCD